MGERKAGRGAGGSQEGWVEEFIFAARDWL